MTTKTMDQKKYDGYGGCMLWVIVIVAITFFFASCATTKQDGCGTENYKHRFNK